MGDDKYSISENGSEKALYKRSESFIEGEQHNESQHKESKKTDKHFKCLKNQPKGNQARQKHKERVFKQIIHGESRLILCIISGVAVFFEDHPVPVCRRHCR